MRPTVIVSDQHPVQPARSARLLMYFTARRNAERHFPCRPCARRGHARGQQHRGHRKYLPPALASAFRPPKAAVKGAQQVAGAIFASTLTTVCVFLPIVFTEGLTRQLFADMGLTIAFSLLASLIIALTLVPAMGSTMLKKTKEKKHPLFDKFTAGYQKLLSGALRRKWIVFVIVIGLFAFSVANIFTMGTSLHPENGQLGNHDYHGNA